MKESSEKVWFCCLPLPGNAKLMQFASQYKMSRDRPVAVAYFCRLQMPDHCIFGAKSSLVSSSKPRKQKANTKKNKEHR